MWGMPRGPRLNIPGGIYHVMSRGNRKAPIFEDDHDRERFVDIVAEAVRKHGVRLCAEAQLGNHYHQVVQTPGANLPEYMRHVNGGFSQYSNLRHGRIGHLFNERYTPVLVDTDFHLRIATAYVVTNAVKHGFVDHPRHWRWSSYRATSGLEPAPAYLYLDWLLSAFGCDDLREAQARFCRYLETSRPSMADRLLGVPCVGSSEFQRELRNHIGATLFMSALPRSYRALDRPPLEEMFQLGMPKAERNRQMLRAQVVHAYRVSEIARALCMHPASVSRIVAAQRRKARLS